MAKSPRPNPPGPFVRLPIPKKGDDDFNTTYAAIGRALTHWELLEGRVSTLYNNVVRPAHFSYSIQRSFGSLNAPNLKKQMIAHAAAAFFARFAEQNGTPLQ